MTFKGLVVRGDGIGRQLGFPTANVQVEGAPPPNGVWAVKVRNLGNGVCNVGVRPTVGGAKLVVEIHLLDFSGDLYGQELLFETTRKLREERKFPSLDALREQIARDVEAARDAA